MTEATTNCVIGNRPHSAAHGYLCGVEGCEQPRRGKRDWCAKHIERWRRWGDPTVVKARERGTCSEPDCSELTDARGLCRRHYNQWRKVTKPAPSTRVRYSADDTCSVDGCDAPPKTRGWCSRHHQRWAKHGDPTATTWRTMPAAERLLARISKTASGCWELPGPLNSSGYAWHAVGGRHLLAHRYSYETFVGPIPEGLDIDHLCRNRICCNPEHLEPVTRRENLARGRQARAQMGDVA